MKHQRVISVGVAAVISSTNRKSITKKAETLHKALTTATTVALVLAGIAADAEVWGIKSHEMWNPPYSTPPATLFHFAEDGSGFQTVAPITVGGSQVDADGLAVDANGTLYTFEVSGGSSRLLTVDKVTAIATPVGSFLNNRNIRGAVIAQSGQLIVLDVAQSQLLEINLTTGEIVGSPVSLTTNGVPYLPSEPEASCCDIAQAPDGTFLVVNYKHFFQLDPMSGDMTLLHTDTVLGQDGYEMAIPGLAFSEKAADKNRIFTYEANGDDEIYTYEYTNGFARSTLFTHIISSFNSGRGDLAAQIQALRPVLSIRLSEVESSQVEVCWTSATNATYRVECRSDLMTNTWVTLLECVPSAGAETCIYDTILQDQMQRFYRVALTNCVP